MTFSMAQSSFNKYSVGIEFVAIIAMAAPCLMGCGDGNSDSNGSNGSNGSGGDYTVSGELTNYDLGEKTISNSNRPDLAEGTVNADGTFEVTLADASTVEEFLEPVAESGSPFDGFSGFACTQEVYDQVGTDIEFAAFPALTYLGEDNEVKTAGLTSATRPDVTFPLPSAEGFHVRWIYASEAVTIQSTCSDGARSMDLELDAGWNEMIIERISIDNNSQYTGERPTEVEWIVD